MIRANDQAQGLRLVTKSQGARPPRRSSPRHGTRTIAVTSGKGGVGKTQLSANLAHAMAKLGDHVLLLDADLGLASLDLALGVEAPHDLMKLVQGHKSIDEVLVRGQGVDLLPACPGRYEMANLAPHDRARLMDAVHELAIEYDAVIIDTGAGLGTNTVSFAAEADDVVLVVTPEPTAFRDAYAMAKVLHRRNGVQQMQVVVNQVRDRMQGFEVFARLEEVAGRFLELELSYLGSLPRDESVTRAVALGAPYMLGAPDSQVARSTEAVVRRLRPTLCPQEDLC
ncbi:MAG: AAA family ATPase [Myxococcales bacterium]|nr:AAA family ATPase [Myxococcales bacterium]